MEEPKLSFELKKVNKFIVLLLVASVLLGTVNSDVFAQQKKHKSFESGIFYDVEKDNLNEVSLKTEQDDYVYETTYNKNSEDVNITCSKDGIFNEKEVYNYSVDIINFDPSKNILEYNIKDKKTGNITHVNDSNGLTAQAPIAIYGGIALGELIIDALIAAAAVATISGVTYYTASKVIEKAKKTNKYFYYAALINSELLCIGGAFPNSSTAKAYAADHLSDSKFGVFCFGGSAAYNASSIASGVSPVSRSISDAAHKQSEGYYAHYHPALSKSGSNHYALHVWYV